VAWSDENVLTSRSNTIKLARLSWQEARDIAPHCVCKGNKQIGQPKYTIVVEESREQFH